MKRMICAMVLAVAGLGVSVPPAVADTPRCVTKMEFRKISKGMGQRRVHRVFDIRGRRVAFARTGRFTSEIRAYRTCSGRGAVSVSYGNRRVDAKAAVWVR